MTRKRYSAAIPGIALFAAAAVLALSSCVSAPASETRGSDARQSPASAGAPEAGDAAAGPFYEQNIRDFEHRTLSNGIRLIVKRNPASRVLNLKLVIRGGSSLVPSAKAGLEAVTLSLLSRGSASYPYGTVLETEHRTSSGVSSASGYDYSTYDLNCIDKYLPELLDIYLDGFLRPAFDPERFRDVMNEAALAMESRMGNPDQRGRFVGTQAIFTGHPYESDPSGTPSSLENITLEDVRACHRSMLNAERLFLVAVGNYDADDLASKLEAALGSLPRAAFSPPALAAPKTSGPVILEPHTASENVAYIQGYFRIPGPADRDYIPFAVAADMLNDLLFNIVREKYGACYSLRTTFRPGAASYGTLWIYQASDIEGVRRYVREAAEMLASGSLIRSKDTATGEYVLASVADRLPAYRNKYVNSVFAIQKRNADVSAQIARGLVYAQDPADYLRYPDRIKAVTPADVQRVYKTWFLGQSFRWVVVSDEEGLKRVPVEEYK